MARSSIQGGDRAPTQAEGRDVESLGPSDSSDSGSDIVGQGDLELASPLDVDRGYTAAQPGRESDSDAAGTGERGAALPDEQPDEASDILPDEVRSLSGEAEDAADVAAQAELELQEMESGDMPPPDEDADLDDAGR